MGFITNFFWIKILKKIFDFLKKNWGLMGAILGAEMPILGAEMPILGADWGLKNYLKLRIYDK